MNTSDQAPNRFVVVAFTASGPSVQKGDRIVELLAQEWIDGAPTSRTVYYRRAAQQLPFHAAFSALQGLIGKDPAVIHDRYDWKRFVRAELKGMNAAEIVRSFDQAVDVSAWSQTTYPRQRRDMNSLARRLGLSELPSGDLEREAHVLGNCAVTILVRADPAKATQQALPDEEGSSTLHSPRDQERSRTFARIVRRLRTLLLPKKQKN